LGRGVDGSLNFRLVAKRTPHPPSARVNGLTVVVNDCGGDGAEVRDERTFASSATCRPSSTQETGVSGCFWVWARRRRRDWLARARVVRASEPGHFDRLRDHRV